MEEISLDAQEELACRMLLDFAKAFYSDPKTRRAYEAWRAARKSHEVERQDVGEDIRPSSEHSS